MVTDELFVTLVSKLRPSVVLLLAAAGVAFGSSTTRDPASITVTEVSEVLAQAYESVKDQDIDSLCELGGSRSNCFNAWRNLGGWDAAPTQMPEIVGDEVLPDRDLGHGGVSRGGRLLTVTGTNGLGADYRTEFLVFDEGDGNLVALNPVFWSGVSVGHFSANGTDVAGSAHTPAS